MKIFRISNLLFMVVATFFGVSLFWTSQAVQIKESELAVARKNLEQEKETVRVLSVEWDYLNRPQRLEKMAVEQLGMLSPSVNEVVQAVSDIPEPAVVVSTDPQVFEEGFAQSVSLEPEKKVVAVNKEAVVAPASAEKQSFDRLIQSLDAEGAGQ